MIDYYEQLTQEEKEEVTDVIQTLYHQTFLLEENLINVREGCSIQKNTVPVRSIWNFLKHILRWRGSHCGKMYIWV